MLIKVSVIITNKVFSSIYIHFEKPSVSWFSILRGSYWRLWPLKIFKKVIVHKGVLVPHFSKHPPQPALPPPFFKIFVSPSFFFIPPPLTVFRTIIPTLMQTTPSCPNPTIYGGKIIIFLEMYNTILQGIK